MQTLAYLLPVLTLALQNAEAEFEQLSKSGKSHAAGGLHSWYSLYGIVKRTLLAP